MILKHLTKRWYHIRKPRMVTENKQSLREYRLALRQSRKKVHEQAKQYQQMIQDQYLSKHAQQMRLKHFNNECNFRKIIAQQGFKLQQNIQYWRKQDQKIQNKKNKYFHDQDVKRINRERIKKIMTYQSDNYWYNSQNVQKRLTDQVIFPQYIASTQYYHRLHTQALAYQNYDFNMLHRVRSNQEVIQQKNKLLIPLFNDIKIKIKQYKTDKQKQINYYHQIAIDKINIIENITQTERVKLINQENSLFEKKVTQFRDRLTDPIKRQNFIRQKLRILLSILGSWKQYTNILGMTSAQMMRQIEEGKTQSDISGIRKNVMNQIKSIRNTTFVDAIQEDTEDTQITLQDYVEKLKIQSKQDKSIFDLKESAANIELDGLLKNAQNSLKSSKIDLNKKEQSVKLDLGSMVQGLQHPIELQVSEIPVSFLNFTQTTSGIQIMKQVYQQDSQMIKLLNQIGQVSVQYPKLFENIWQSTHSVV